MKKEPFERGTYKARHIVFDPTPGVAIPDEFLPQNWRRGDIIEMARESSYKNRWFVNADMELIHDPDSHDRFFRVPLEASRNLKNSVESYQHLISDPELLWGTLWIAHDDEWIVDTYGKPFPEGWLQSMKYKFGEFLGFSVDFLSGNSLTFDENDSYEHIISTVESKGENKMMFLIWFCLTGEQADFHYKDLFARMPEGWHFSRHSGAMGGGHHYSTAVHFQGPPDTMDEAIARTKEFFHPYELGIYVGTILNSMLEIPCTSWATHEQMVAANVHETVIERPWNDNDESFPE